MRGCGYLRPAIACALLVAACLLPPRAAPAAVAACAGDVVCAQSSGSPADDWFRQGIEALSLSENEVAACALEKATELDPDEDGHSLSAFVKPMLGGVKPPPRDCAQSSAPLDKKKYFPRLYLAKAYFEWALRSADAEKSDRCERAFRALAASRSRAPLARVRQQWERKVRIDRALADSRCCELLPDDSQCQDGSAK